MSVGVSSWVDATHGRQQLHLASSAIASMWRRAAETCYKFVESDKSILPRNPACMSRAELVRCDRSLLHVSIQLRSQSEEEYLTDCVATLSRKNPGFTGVRATVSPWRLAISLSTAESTGQIRDAVHAVASDFERLVRADSRIPLARRGETPFAATKINAKQSSGRKSWLALEHQGGLRARPGVPEGSHK